MTKVRWGVLGVAKIATKKVIPAMQRGSASEIVAIASRDPAKARAAAAELGIARAHGSYEDMLADPEIDAIYNPLPNHLHVPWSIRAAEAGKHVLCEKPVGLDVAQVRELIAARDRTGVKIGEAFMVRSHPQWIRARDIAQSGQIGELRSIITAFSYYLTDPANVRNILDQGGGALYDIGCYPIQISRFVTGREPIAASGLIERDPVMHVDRLTSAMLDFGSLHSIFTVCTQMSPYQRVLIIGSTGRVEVEIPFNAPPDQPCRIFVNDEAVEFDVCDQYTLQGDQFSRAILGEGDVPTPLEDSLCNMAVIDAVFRSAGSRQWESVQ